MSIIRRLRLESAKLSLSAFAEVTDIDRMRLSQLEEGAVPEAEELRLIAEALGVEPAVLIESEPSAAVAEKSDPKPLIAPSRASDFLSNGEGEE